MSNTPERAIVLLNSVDVMPYGEYAQRAGAAALSIPDNAPCGTLVLVIEELKDKHELWTVVPMPSMTFAEFLHPDSYYLCYVSNFNCPGLMAHGKGGIDLYFQASPIERKYIQLSEVAWLRQLRAELASNLERRRQGLS